MRVGQASETSPEAAWSLTESNIARYGKAELLRARPSGNGSGDCTVTSGDGTDVVMRPFMTIKEESYSTYVQMKA
jgi:hypothetical protein